MSIAVRRLLLAWIGLIALLALTVGLAFLPLGAAKPAAAYLIATAKAALVLWYFMELRREGGLPRLAAGAGFVWLSVLLVLTAADFLSRN
ncbi:MAG: cytochrome C oxidase subunit IV family protein [Novosphingobium sp.]|nr:cytochrome C oxidase subunit IV family protein [Novosphingobium sp.]